jgi:hypothetical protein
MIAGNSALSSIETTLLPFARRSIFRSAGGTKAASSDAVDPDIAGGLQGRATDSLADQILRRCDAGLRIDEDVAVPEFAEQEHRDRCNRHAAFARDQVGRHVELANIERQLANHAAVPLRIRQLRDERQIDAIDRHAAIEQTANVIEVVAGDGEVNAARHH